MNSSHVSVIAAVTCLTAWTAKGVAIGVAGGLGHSSLEAPLFFVGVVGFVVAVVSLSLALSAGHGRGVRALAVLGGVAAGVGVSLVTGLLVAAVQPADPSWVWGEVNLWVGAVVLVATTLGLASRSRHGLTTSPVRV